MPLRVLVEVFPFHQMLFPLEDFLFFKCENLNALTSSGAVFFNTLQSSPQRRAISNGTVIFVTPPMQYVLVGVEWGRDNNTGQTILSSSGRGGGKNSEVKQ